MKAQFKAEVDKLQMSFIKSANNVEEVEAVLGVFMQMRNLAEQLPEGNGQSPTGAKRGRKPKNL